MTRLCMVIAILVALVAGCTQKQKVGEEHHEETIKATVWTSRTELFMEHDAFSAGKEAEVLLHLTNLSTFKPVIESSVTMLFLPVSGGPFSVKIDKPERPGIFKTKVALEKAGEYSIKVLVQGKAFSDEIVVPDVEVAGKDRDRGKGREHIGGRHEGEGGGGAITFLKEQQWTVDFATGLPERRPVASTFIATGEIVPVSNAEVTVSSPLSGIISLSKQLPYAGKKVSGGEVLAVIEPPISQQGGIGQLTASYAEAGNRVVLARNEKERAKRLYEAKAAAKRRLDEAELAFESAQAAFEPLEKAMQDMKQGSSGNRVIIKAPFSGTVVEVMTSNGKAAEPGQALLRIIDTAKVWLRANVPATEIGGLRNLGRATFTIPGIDGELRPTRLVTVNDIIDPKTRTVPVIFEVSNMGGALKVGMFSDVSIRTGHVENALTLPEEALFEDEGKFFIFVQKDGESFERREVKAGIRGGGLVQMLAGVKEDERVVLKGGYYVKLASLSSRMPDPHAGHAH